MNTWNDELMFKRIAARAARTFSPRFVARRAETFTRHAREIAEGLRGPSARRVREKKKKEQTEREGGKGEIIGRGKTRAGDDMHLCVNPHVSNATALPLSSLPPSHEPSFIIQRGELDERGTRVLSRVRSHRLRCEGHR